MYDVVIIGGGPGGYVAAIYAALSGLKTALVEKDRIGGTCLTKGCIPTKALLNNAKIVHTIREAKKFGIDVAGFTVHYDAMKERKDRVVDELARGVKGLVKSHGIAILEGTGSFVSSSEIKVRRGDEAQVIAFKHAVIASGSVPMALPFCPVDGTVIHDSTTILEMTRVPKKLIVLGGGYIGCEFASLFNALGSIVTIVEFLPNIVMLQGKSVSSFLENAFRQRGIELMTNVKMERVEKTGNGILCFLSDGTKVEGDALLVSVGRAPYTDELRLQNALVTTDARGFIEVNDSLQTQAGNIYAIGDVTGKSMLAHTASHQAIVAVHNMLGQKKRMHYDRIPAVIFTDPEIATIGYTLEEARKKGFDAVSSTFPFRALGKAKAVGDEEGFAELVTNPKTGQIYGAFMIGHEAGNMISEIAVCIENELTVESLGNTIHPHPTFSEVWLETAHLALGKPIHLPKR
ncbi:MAG: dihydrolipoyl dehydrogenase [Chlamydiae bacterium RIFCSPHIGHO2_12_FULL_49_11]|nr:MAG: dihydrolipoyl dehydrogenase [Chlamydiae bacterium RIFCSPHIGHO2_12_FULL_49_11]